MKRHHLISIHLILSTFLLPFLLMMPVSGTLYLLGQKGDQVSTVVFNEELNVPEGMEERETFFRTLFRDRSVDPEFDFEYIRDGGDTLIFRPSSRDHYVAKIKGSSVEISKVEPNFLKSMVELHKGHGPTLFRYYEMVFGVGLILMALSGVWLALLVPAYRKTLTLSFLGGTVFFLAFALF